MERRRYERQVEFWVQGSNLEPSKQASRLMSGLSGRAEEAAHWLRARDVSSDTKYDPEGLDNGSGVGKLLQTLRAIKMTPDQQLESATEKFFALCRASGEEHHRYMIRAIDVRRKLEGEDASFTMGNGMWTMMMLRSMGLERSEEAQVLTSIGFVYTDERVIQVLKQLGPHFNVSSAGRPAFLPQSAATSSEQRPGLRLGSRYFRYAEQAFRSQSHHLEESNAMLPDDDDSENDPEASERAKAVSPRTIRSLSSLCRISCEVTFVPRPKRQVTRRAIGTRRQKSANNFSL